MRRNRNVPTGWLVAAADLMLAVAGSPAADFAQTGSVILVE